MYITNEFRGVADVKKLLKWIDSIRENFIHIKALASDKMIYLKRG